ncbi:hexitol phosphatase HxpB [Dinghuibacter silviterrae]|uniref:Sugar-phosphatase n=1 Tax=Dinghuibacter silviterrae TaxID=1539049 RepID=A0A4R8DFR0_9BACT|nr:hexitol phosphatase HxpB [Dinghuibacter silviterrae]TDW95780.1 sugar-phosphatase [Dinghuibacter silviterrae]
MQPTTVIFDMDGLLIDSEPLWGEAAEEILARFNVRLTNEQYHQHTGLRTREFLTWWFSFFGISPDHLDTAETDLVDLVIQKVKARPKFQPGVPYILDFFKARGFKIGLASSSPMRLIDTVEDLGQFGDYFQVKTSAEYLPFGKPHPQVYLECARALGVSPLECVAFEDSFNGMIAAKAARMSCVVVPAPDQQRQLRWHAANLKLSSLANFNDLLLEAMGAPAETLKEC